MAQSNGRPDAQEASELLHEAASLNNGDPNLTGSMLRFGGAGQLVLTGDMHGNQQNFTKLQRYCQLDRSPGRYVVLHELIHAEPQPPEFLDLSIDLLLDAVRWKVTFPDNVYFLQSNHELSQLMRHEISKGGRSILSEFRRGLEHRFAADAERVLDAVDAYIASLPLALRTARGLFCAHSLPGSQTIGRFDYSIFDRRPTAVDYQPGGPAYELVWGRFQRPAEVDQFAEQLEVETIVVGHTPQDEGLYHDGRMLIIASDHNHGVFVPVDLSKTPVADELARAARKFVSVE